MKSLRLSLAACLALLPTPALHAVDGSLQFTAASQQRVEVPNFNGLGISNAATVEFWALSTTNGIAQSVFMLSPDSQANRFQAHLNYFNGNTYWDFGDIGNGGRISLPNQPAWLNTWTHFAMVVSETGGMKIYANGQPVASGPQFNALESVGTAILRIGGSAGFYFEGKLDEFRIWNTARTQAEIQANLATQLAGNETGLKLYYKFDDGTGSTAVNSATATGAAFNGTLAGNTLPAWSAPGTFTVTSAADSGAGSLRQAIADALAAAGPNTIVFSPTVFNGEAADVITLGSEMVVSDAAGVKIDGSAIPRGVKIDGGAGTNRIFSVAAGANLALSGLTLTGGGGGGAALNGVGGAILNQGSLSLVDCTLSGNSTLTLTTSLYKGGAIRSTGPLTLDRCTFSGNSAYEGGAVRSENSQCVAIRCTFAQNSATLGGGLSIADGGPAASLVDCTISGNSASGTSVTGIASNGGGVFTYDKLVTVTNCLIAGNTGTNGPDFQNVNQSTGAITSGGGNLIGNNTGLSMAAVGNDLIGTGAAPIAPRLGPLADNGGLTPTMLPLPGSPARDRIASSTLTTDQRGAARKLWGAIDVGAAEAGIQADCAWEVREAFTSPVTNLGTLAATDALLANPAATSISSTAAVINFADLNGGAVGLGSLGFFPGDTLYASDNLTPGGLSTGNDDKFALQARTFVTISTEDDYTFGFSSDDGARLRLYSTDGGANPAFSSSTRLNPSNPANPAHSGNTLSFDQNTGNSDTLGVVHLLPGTYGVEFVTWDDGGGAYAEVFLARGARTVVDGNFRLLGDTGGTVPQRVGTVFSWMVDTVASISSYTAAVDAISSVWCAPPSPTPQPPVPVTGLRFTSANDGPERDPMTFVLEGSMGTLAAGPWTTVATGSTGLSSERLAAAPAVTFPNTVAYLHYRLTFPTVRVVGVANSMQIGEVDFLSSTGAHITRPGDPVQASSANSPGAEAAANAIDDSPSKYLNFDKLNAGFSVTPSFRESFSTLNFADPQSGGGGHGLTQLPFPGNTAADDNEFALGARATLTVPTGGDYTFLVLADDGVRFRIVGSRGWTAFGGAGATALVDGFEAPECCADAFGQVRLAAGSYRVEVIFNEIGGGASLGVWAAPGRLSSYDSRFFSLLGGTAPVLAAPAVALARTPGLNRPLNDDFASAFTLTGPVVHAAGCNDGAALEIGEPATGNRAKSVWWNWTAPASGAVQVDTIGSDFNTVLAVLTGTSTSALTEVALNDNSGGSGTSRLTFAATAGMVYRLQVSGWGSSTGTIRLNLAQLAAPSNDAYANASDLGAVSRVSVSGSTLVATAEPGEPDAYAGGDAATGTVWHRWTAPSTGVYIVDTRGSNFNTALAVFSGTALNALTSVGSNGNGGGDGTSALAFLATGGTTYYIVVDGIFGSSRGTYFLSIVPGLSDLPNVTVMETVAPVPIPFTVGDPAWQTTMPVIAVTSNNQAALPNASLVVSGTGCSARTLTLPALTMAANGTVVTVSTTVDGIAVSDTFSLTVIPAPVNQAPSFVKGANQSVPTNAGPQTVPGWATAINPGAPEESGQTLTFEIAGNTNPGLFVVAPAISSDGTLTYVPAPTAGGTATISVRLRDNGGTANGGVDVSPVQTFTITTTLPATTGTSLTINAGGSGSGTAAVTQNFNTLGSVSTPWVNNSTVPGWYAQINDGNTPTGTFEASNGSTVLTGLINCGSTAAPADRALGSKATGTGNIANISYAVVIRNVGNLPVKLSRLRYAEELWRSGSIANTPDKVTAFYAVSDAPLASIASGPNAATAVPGTGFSAFAAGASTQIASTTTGTALDGNLAANRSVVDFTPAVGTLPAVLPGQYFTVKWTDANEATATDGHQAIDDVILDFTEVPCAIYAAVNSVVRHFDGVDGTNDTVDVTLTVAGAGSGLSPAGWSLTAPTAFVTTGSYGVPKALTGIPIGAFATTPVVSIRDAADANCTTTVSVPLPIVLGLNVASGDYIQVQTPPAIFRQTAVGSGAEVTMDPGSSVLLSDAVAVTPGSGNEFYIVVDATDTSASTGFEALDTLKVELISTTPSGTEIELITDEFDLDRNGVINGGATPLVDEFNQEQKPNAASWTTAFVFAGTIPPGATSFRVRISATIDGNVAGSSTEVFRFKTATFYDFGGIGDVDGDGVPNLWEAAHGTDPDKPESHFGLVETTSNGSTQNFILRTDNAEDRSYQLLSSTNGLTWTRDGLPLYVPGIANGPWPLTTITRPLTDQRRLYRILVTAPPAPPVP